MLTRTRHAESSPRKAGNGFDARKSNTSDRRSLRLRDAPVGSAALGSIVSAVLMIPVGSSFAGKGTPLSRVLSIVILLFAPGILGAIYSLFFEKSKVYGSLDLLLAGIVLLVQPFTWVWLSMYFPFALSVHGLLCHCAPDTTKGETLNPVANSPRHISAWVTASRTRNCCYRIIKGRPSWSRL